MKSDKHKIWQTFVENDILTFDMLIDTCTLVILKNMKLKKGNTSVDAFTGGKIKLVNNILLYYTFWYQDDRDTLAEDRILWDKDNFRNWKSNGYPKSTAAYTASQASNATTTKVIPTEIISSSKIISNSNIDPADDVEIDNGKFQSSTVNVPIITTTPAPEIHANMLSKEEVISNIPAICIIVSDKAVTLNEIRTERVSNEEAISNLDVVDVDDVYLNKDFPANGDDNEIDNSIHVVAADDDETTTTTTTTTTTKEIPTKIILTDMNLNLNINSSKEEGTEPGNVSLSWNVVAVAVAVAVAAAATDIDNKINNQKFCSSTVAIPTTTTPLVFVLNK